MEMVPPGVGVPAAPNMVGVVGFDRPGVWAMPPSVDADENRLALDWKPPAPAKEKLGVLAPRAGVGESPRVGWDANAALDMNGFDAPPMLPKMPVDGELAAGAAPKAPKVEVEVAPNIPPEAAGAPNIPPDAAPNPGADIPAPSAGWEEKEVPKVAAPAVAAPNIPVVAPSPAEAELNPPNAGALAGAEAPTPKPPKLGVLAAPRPNPTVTKMKKA